MKKIYVIASFLLFSLFAVNAQTGYDIKINFKGCKDSTVYLARYFFDQVPVSDSCKKIKNGKIEFKGKTQLDKGVYILANQAKNSFYFQFIVDDSQKFTINLEGSDVAATLKSPDSKENDEFFSYVRFMTAKNREMMSLVESLKGKSDSATLASEKQKTLSAETVKFDADFMTRNKGTYVWDIMNLKTEKFATDIPLASNGRPDSIYQYYYYRNHYFEGVNFKNDKILCIPFFAEKIKKYYDQIVPQHPDSVIKELDKVLLQCIPGSDMFNTLIGHFTYKFETNKAMSFDQYGNSNTFEKVFVHLAENYIVNGKTNGYYSEETVQKIDERIRILKNLLPGAKVPNLFMIDTVHGREVLNMGFDTARTSYGATFLYNKNTPKLNTLYKQLYEVKAKYTVLVFWAADCGHCQTEIPKLNEDLKEIKGKIDYKVFAVQTKEELFDTWKKFILEKKLNDFTHVFDPVHVNNLKEQFDIQGTPVIYLLDKDKKIKGKKISSDQVVDILKKLEEIEKNNNK